MNQPEYIQSPISLVIGHIADGQISKEEAEIVYNHYYPKNTITSSTNELTTQTISVDENANLNTYPFDKNIYPIISNTTNILESIPQQNNLEPSNILTNNKQEDFTSQQNNLEPSNILTNNKQEELDNKFEIIITVPTFESIKSKCVTVVAHMYDLTNKYIFKKYYRITQCMFFIYVGAFLFPHGAFSGNTPNYIDSICVTIARRTLLWPYYFGRILLNTNF
jgi:hypothetical protein